MSTGVFGPATLAALEAAVAGGEIPSATDGDVKTARLTTSDGLDQTLDVVTCGFVSESEFELVGRTETSDHTIDVRGEESSVVYTRADGNREETVDAVGGDSMITVAGDLTKGDDGAEPATFEVVADCG